jgi:hypothetical protein
MTAIKSFEYTVVFNASIDIFGQTGTIAISQFGTTINLSQLFDGTPQFYPGSLIQIQEVMTLVTRIEDPKLVDVDYRWAFPREYRGTFQLFGALGLPTNTVEDQGQILAGLQEISRYSWYTITANPDTIVAKHEQFSVDNCNFYLQPEVYLFPGTNTPIAGFRTTPDLTPTFLGSTTISKAPLLNTQFNQKITGVGLFLYAGIQGVRVEYKAGVINTVYTDYEQADVPQCIFLGTPNCQQQFNSFVVAGGYVNAPVNGVIYDSEAACLGDNQSLCSAQTYVCPTNPSETFTYWIATPT